MYNTFFQPSLFAFIIFNIFNPTVAVAHALLSENAHAYYLFCPQGCWVAGSPAWWAGPWSPHPLLVSLTPCYRGSAPSCPSLLLCKTHLCLYHRTPGRQESERAMFRAPALKYTVLMLLIKGPMREYYSNTVVTPVFFFFQTWFRHLECFC